MNQSDEINAPSWFADHDALIAQLRHGEYVPKAAPGLAGFDDLHEIGRGGQAVVYLGTQRSTKRRAAVKVLLDGAFTSQANRRRFEREIELVASLRHPNIVGIYDSGRSEDGHSYCVMEYVEGVSLGEYVTGLDLSDARGSDFRKFLQLFGVICDAVNHAHRRGVLHRDLKPGNIRIDRDGQPHVLDFGLAKTMDRAAMSASDAGVSVTGQFVGSLAWASPEQTEGDSDRVDIRSDVYSLGIILFYSLTRDFPYPITGALHDILERIRHAEPVRPHQLNRQIDAELETIILRCLAKEPDRRYQTAGEVAADIRRYLAGEPLLARGDSAWYTIRKTMRRYRTGMVVAGVVMASAIALSLVMTVSYRRAARAEGVARQAEGVARQEVARSKVVISFLEDMLSSADPEAKGRDVTVRAVLDEAEKGIDAGLGTEPAVQASLHAIVGKTYRSLGELDKARRHVEAAVALWGGLHGDADERVIEARNDVADILLDQSKLDEAETIISDLVLKIRAKYPDDHQLSIGVAAALGRLRRLQGKWEEAESIFVPLIERMSRVIGAEAKQTLTIMNSLAIVYHTLGKLAEAEALHRRVLNIHTSKRGEDSPGALIALGNLASVMNSQGKLVEAESLLRRQISMATRVWGAEHPSVLSGQSNLVFTLHQQDKFEDAREIAERNLAIQKRVLGVEHTDTINSMNSLASVYMQLSRHREASALAREAYEICLRVYGEDNVDTLTSMHNLAAAHLKMGELEEAGALFAKNLELCRKQYQVDHPELAWPMNDLAGVWRRQGKTDQAVAMYTDAIRIIRKGLPADHYFLPWVMRNRGNCLRNAGRLDEAERDLLECYEIYRGQGESGQADVQDTLGSIVALYESKGDSEKLAHYRALQAATSKPATAEATAGEQAASTSDGSGNSP